MLLSKVSDDPITLQVNTHAISLNNARELKEELMQYLPHSNTQLVLDFEKVFLLDSSALGALISVQKELAQSGSELIIRNASKSIKEMLHNVRLNEFVTIQDD
ncbi:MAG: anti-sigma factor antagonist [Candidatus Hydrogenedentota bacterium]|nr:MAG: anti-sigma factor antagonist [Candidatus Hydrogenedentota bacterium]